MSDNTSLAAHHAMMSKGGRAGNAHLSNKQRMCTNFCAVPYRHQIPEFASLSYDSIADGTSFYSTTGADLDIIFDYSDSNLRYFVVNAFMCRKAESVFSYGRVCIYDNPVSN